MANWVPAALHDGRKCALHNVVGRPCDQKIPVTELRKLSRLKDGQEARVNGKTVTGNSNVRGMAGFALRARNFKRR